MTHASPAIADRYLDLIQEVLINAIYQDNSMAPWTPAVYDAQTRSSGRDWPEKALTMIGRVRLKSLRSCCEDVLQRNIPGDFVETGICAGACIMMAAVLAAHSVSNRTVWGFDSFEGLPPPDEAAYPHDQGDVLHHYRELAVSLEEVTENFRRLGLLSNQVRLVKGWFRETVPIAPVETIAVLRLDGDLYESTIQVLGAFYPRLAPGGYCIIDDFGSHHGCERAVADYRGDHNITEALVDIDGLGVLWQKPIV